MAALAELIIAILAFLFEVTFHALVFVVYLMLAIFSPTYRGKLKEKWNTSFSNRISIVSGIGLYTAALAFALFFWIPFLENEKEREVSDEETLAPDPRARFTRDEIRAIRDTKELDELVKVAGDILKRKADELDSEAESEETLDP